MCKSQHYSGENTTIILVASMLKDLAHQDNYCGSRQFNPGIYNLIGIAIRFLSDFSQIFIRYELK